jgi:sugar phosphate isomerase/epimerase
MTPLSLSHLTVLEVAPPALFDLAAEAGYQQVGLRILPVVPGACAYPLDRAALVAWRRRMADTGIGVHDVEFVPLTPEVRVERLAPTLELAAELGARRLSVSGDDADFDRLAQRFGALCDLAASVGLGVDLEFMWFRAVGTLGQALEIIQRAARPNGRLLVDALHLIRSGGSTQALRAVPPEALGSAQLCDAPLHVPPDANLVEEARQGRMFPGEGELPLRAFLEALPQDLPLAVEVPTGRTHPELTHLARATRACAATRGLLASLSPMR